MDSHRLTQVHNPKMDDEQPSVTNTLNKVQKIQVSIFKKSQNTAQSFIVVIYEKFFFSFSSVWKKLLLVPTI